MGCLEGVPDVFGMDVEHEAVAPTRLFIPLQPQKLASLLFELPGWPQKAFINRRMDSGRVLEVLTQQSYVWIFVAANWAVGAKTLEFPPQNVLSLVGVQWTWGRNPLPVLGSLFSSCCRVGIVLTSVFCYFALLGNYFVYSVMSHLGSSLNFDLKSVLSMAERITTSWKRSWSMFNFWLWILALGLCSVDLRNFGFVGWGEEWGCRALAAESCQWMSPAAVGWFWFDYLSLSQAVTAFGHWRLSGSTAWIFHSFQLVISAALGVLEVE